MTDKRNARPAGSTAERAKQERQHGEAAVPYFNSTTTTTGSQPKIADYLGHSEETALTITDLERLTGQRSREIRKRIETERRAGILIVANNKNGYWLTGDSGEARRFAKSMLHRSREIAKTAQAVETAAERMED